MKIIIIKKMGGSGQGGSGLGGQGGWERRIEAFVRIQKKKTFEGGGGGPIRGWGGGGWVARFWVGG